MKTDSMNKFDYLYLGAMIVDLFVVIAGWDWLVMSSNNNVAMTVAAVFFSFRPDAGAWLRREV